MSLKTLEKNYSWSSNVSKTCFFGFFFAGRRRVFFGLFSSFSKDGGFFLRSEEVFFRGQGRVFLGFLLRVFFGFLGLGLFQKKTKKTL